MTEVQDVPIRFPKTALRVTPLESLDDEVMVIEGLGEIDDLDDTITNYFVVPVRMKPRHIVMHPEKAIGQAVEVAQKNLQIACRAEEMTKSLVARVQRLDAEIAQLAPWVAEPRVAAAISRLHALRLLAARKAIRATKLAIVARTMHQNARAAARAAAALSRAKKAGNTIAIRRALARVRQSVRVAKKLKRVRATQRITWKLRSSVARERKFQKIAGVMKKRCAIGMTRWCSVARKYSLRARDERAKQQKIARTVQAKVLLGRSSGGRVLLSKGLRRHRIVVRPPALRVGVKVGATLSALEQAAPTEPLFAKVVAAIQKARKTMNVKKMLEKFGGTKVEREARIAPIPIAAGMSATMKIVLGAIGLGGFLWWRRRRKA